MNSGTASTVGGDTYVHQSYSQWVRQAIALTRRRGNAVVSLFESSVAEPRELLRDTVARMIEPDFSSSYRSTFGGGNPLILDALAARYGVERANVIGTTGATGALSMIYRALARPGDHIIVETPGFDLFHDLARDGALQVGTFRRRSPAYGIDAAEVEALLRPNTRLIVLSDLHNPSGMLLQRAELDALLRLAEARGVYVVVDEVYGDYADRSARGYDAASLSPMAISVSSLTKIYGLATLRCGWIVAADEPMTALRRHAERIEFGISNLAHGVAVEVLRDVAPFRAHTDAVLDSARPILNAWAEAMIADGCVDGAPPSWGCIYFPRLIGVDDTCAFAEMLIDRHDIIVAPGEYFGAPGHIRIGFGLPSSVLRQSLERLSDMIRTTAKASRDYRMISQRAPAA